ncbi:MAG: hypothetical protein A2Z08_07685 [Deltaproteobacteria bacterium RBG_16_54_11]|nr:MAG: hypothetical protein A2Z08_07685 [Deltaproteobacteria bacterium RBG_16_54_11]
MIFNAGDGRFLGAQFIRNLFLSEAGFDSGLFQKKTNFKLIISPVKIFGEIDTALLSFFNIFVQIVYMITSCSIPRGQTLKLIRQLQRSAGAESHG